MRRRECRSVGPLVVGGLEMRRMAYINGPRVIDDGKQELSLSACIWF